MVKEESTEEPVQNEEQPEEPATPLQTSSVEQVTAAAEELGAPAVEQTDATEAPSDSTQNVEEPKGSAENTEEKPITAEEDVPAEANAEESVAPETAPEDLSTTSATAAQDSEAADPSNTLVPAEEDAVADESKKASVDDAEDAAGDVSKTASVTEPEQEQPEEAGKASVAEADRAAEEETKTASVTEAADAEQVSVTQAEEGEPDAKKESAADAEVAPDASVAAADPEVAQDASVAAADIEVAQDASVAAADVEVAQDASVAAADVEVAQDASVAPAMDNEESLPKANADEKAPDDAPKEPLVEQEDTKKESEEAPPEPQVSPEDQAKSKEPSKTSVGGHEEMDAIPGPPPGTGRVAASTGAAPGGADEFDVDPHAISPRIGQPTETCTVKFRLMPGGQVHTERCSLSQTLLALKQHLCNELKVPVEMIVLIKDGKETADYQTLPDLGVVPNKTVDIEVLSFDPTNYPIRSLKQRQEYHMPDVITVRVLTDTNEMKDVVVEIERAVRKKPFLGGYKHKQNGYEYHHASAQTMQKQRPPPGIERFCRDTQTMEEKNRLQQTRAFTSTQMTKIGVYVANIPDKLLVPGPYTTADEHNQMLLERIIILQKYYRRWLAKRYVEKVRQDKIDRLEWEREQELKKKEEKAIQIKREFERRMNPKTQEDFDCLYAALEKWRLEEIERINCELDGAERKAALCLLLDQEAQLINSIGRHKIDANDENRLKIIQGFLSKAAAPKKWKGRDGKITLMDTPYTIRAQELKDIYNSINMKYLTQDERLDVLLTLKHTVKEHDCKLTQEVIELIDREADLLMRGVKEGNLEGLRKRISTLFLQYIKTPTFNPEAARLLKVPQDPSVLRKDIYFCQSCNQYKPSVDFQLTSNSKSVGRCRKCNATDNDARTRQDYSHYRYMIKTLRTTEEEHRDNSQISFLLQEVDLRYLVENVWSSQSVLSAWPDLYDLVLVRWDKHTEWSPWNCILLTKEEAAAHGKLQHLDEAYGKALVHKVMHKHTLARSYFSRVPAMAQYLRRYDNKESNKEPEPSVTGVAVKSQPLIQPVS